MPDDLSSRLAIDSFLGAARVRYRLWGIGIDGDRPRVAIELQTLLTAEGPTSGDGLEASASFGLGARHVLGGGLLAIQYTLGLTQLFAGNVRRFREAETRPDSLGLELAQRTGIDARLSFDARLAGDDTADIRLGVDAFVRASVTTARAYLHLSGPAALPSPTADVPPRGEIMLRLSARY